MRALVFGDAAASGLSDLRDVGDPSLEVWEGPVPDGPPAALAAALVAIEKRLLADPVDVVVLAGAGDAALAAALVATKLEIPIRVVDGSQPPAKASQRTTHRVLTLLANPPAPPTLAGS